MKTKLHSGCRKTSSIESGKATLGASLFALLICSWVVPDFVNAQSATPISAQALSPTPVQTFYTNQKKFQVPFNVNANGRDLIEVQLFASADLGKTWTLHSRQGLTQGHFKFQCAFDQEVWFSIKSVDRDQRVFPAGKNKPDLKIIIDSAKPALDIKVESDAVGRMVTAIQTTDSNLDPQSIQVEYRDALNPNGPWTDTGFENKTPVASGVFHDRIAWWPKHSFSQMEIRVTVKDKAGNSAQATGNAKVSPTARMNRQVASPKNSNPAQLPDQPLSAFQNASHGQQIEQGDQYFSANNQIPGSSGSKPQVGSQNSVAWESQTQNSPHHRISSSTTGQDRTNSQAVTDSTPFRSVGNRNLMVSEGSTHPKLTRSEPNPKATVPTRSTSTTTSYRLSHLMEIARPTNQAKFLLTYDVDAIRAADIREVGLWMTHDGGRSWRKWAIDTDKQSPFAVKVPQEGIYGFRIVISSNDGINSRIPRGGEAADMWVRYDQKAPQLQITSVPYGRGPNAGKLVINWTAADEQLTLRPITLEYSHQAEGPWTKIETGLRNTGSYVWKVPQHVPESIHLRVRARDTAGNHATFQLKNPVNVANLVPRGRIKGMMPLPERGSAQNDTHVDRANGMKRIDRAKVTGFRKIGDDK